jgi:hypothetical protein
MCNVEIHLIKLCYTISIKEEVITPLAQGIGRLPFKRQARACEFKWRAFIISGAT